MSIYRDIRRIEPHVFAALQGLSVANVFDAAQLSGVKAVMVNPLIRPMTPGLRACGQAVTAECVSDNSLAAHCALYLARPGDVLVISAHGGTGCALFGGIMALDATKLGVSGAVIDGAIRDVDGIRQLSFPSWAHSVCARPGEKRGSGSVNVPIMCAGVRINPGDLIIADDDGVLALPADAASLLVAEAGRRRENEHLLRQRVAAGERLFDIAGLGAFLEEGAMTVREGHWVSGELDVLQIREASE